jgi:hypothetical protein
MIFSRSPILGGATIYNIYPALLTNTSMLPCSLSILPIASLDRSVIVNIELNNLQRYFFGISYFCYAFRFFKITVFFASCFRSSYVIFHIDYCYTCSPITSTSLVISENNKSPFCKILSYLPKRFNIYTSSVVHVIRPCTGYEEGCRE